MTQYVVSIYSRPEATTDVYLVVKKPVKFVIQVIQLEPNKLYFKHFLLLDKATTSQAVIVIVSGSDGRAETLLLEPAKVTQKR